MHTLLPLFLKGMLIGGANLIPGVSGGTIALITRIFEPLIQAIKNVDLQAFKYLLKGEFSSLAHHLNLTFLVAVFSGALLSIFTLASVLDYLFLNYPVYIWSFFLGLVLCSVYCTGRQVTSWDVRTWLALALGTAISAGIVIVSPATANQNFFYLLLCGAVAACSMIMPGLSGSFVLILMGNYQLIMIHAVKNLDFQILLPVATGAAVGLALFSRLLLYVFHNFRNITIALLTGFVLGSTAILWPWKKSIYALNPDGTLLLKTDGDTITTGYEWFIPNLTSMETVIAIIILFFGGLALLLVEFFAEKN